MIFGSEICFCSQTRQSKNLRMHDAPWQRHSGRYSRSILLSVYVFFFHACCGRYGGEGIPTLPPNDISTYFLYETGLQIASYRNLNLSPSSSTACAVQNNSMFAPWIAGGVLLKLAHILYYKGLLSRGEITKVSKSVIFCVFYKQPKVSKDA